MTYQHQDFPSWRYGPNGESVIVNSADETPKGFSAGRPKGPSDGTKTAVASPNAGTSPEKAAKTTDAVSRASTDVAKAAKAGHGGAGNTTPAAVPAKAPAKAPAAGLDADGHPFDPALHAATKSKTKAGLWRMKVGVSRPAPAKPLDL